MKSLIAAVFAFAAISVVPASAQNLQGVWMSADGGTKVRISECGRAMCGNIVWLKRPLDENGKPRNDTLNPDAAKRTRPMMGLQVASLRPDKSGGWIGQIYNADEGKSFNVVLTMQSANSATIKGCVLGVLCKSVQWARVG
ncbi:MAG: DUF2147 domain-containing protein [Pseudolabrys sp.]